jgi:hypothetical protein
MVQETQPFGKADWSEMRALRLSTSIRSTDGPKRHLVLLCYGTYALVVSAVVALLLWPFVVLWPGPWRRRYFAARFGAKCVQRLTRGFRSRWAGRCPTRDRS